MPILGVSRVVLVTAEVFVRCTVDSSLLVTALDVVVPFAVIVVRIGIEEVPVVGVDADDVLASVVLSPVLCSVLVEVDDVAVDILLFAGFREVV